MQDIISELSWRGLINQTTDDANLPRLLMEKPRTFTPVLTPRPIACTSATLWP